MRSSFGFRSVQRSLVVSMLVLAFAGGCKRSNDGPASQSKEAPAATSSTTTSGVKTERAKPGDAAEVIREAREQASAANRQLVVYVGATWCEPCQYFHAAAQKGELDQAFPKLSILEFDLDQDRDRLNKAGYTSDFIPLFVVPDESGRASDKRFEGSVKGPLAVANITPKLRAILSE